MPLALVIKGIFSSPFAFMAFVSALLLMLTNGWTDAPVSIASAINSGALTLKKASVLSAICNFLGAVTVSLLGNKVAVSVTQISGLQGVEPRLASVAFTASLLSVAVWSLIALYLGLPTSESHALISALAGSSAYVLGFGSVKLLPILKVIIGLFLSTFPVVYLSKKIANILQKRFAHTCYNQKFKGLQILGASMSAFAHGAQDGQKFAGVFAVQMALIIKNQAETEVQVPVYAVGISALLISFGMLLGGRKIVDSLSLFTPKDAISGFSADLTSSFVLVILSVLGVPVSTTSTKISALLGAGNENVKKAYKMFLAWGFTFPMCFLLAYFGVPLLKGLAG